MRALWVSLLLLPNAALGAEWELDLDGRLIGSDAGRSFLDGGLSTVRFGEHDSGVRLGRARLAVAAPIGELWSVHADASSWGDHDKMPLGLTEAYLQWRPYPWSGYRLRVKAGAFYAPISLENRASGWESPYTLSYSAINSWVGEELRTLGLEAQLDWLGTRLRHDFDAGLTGGVFGWNDDAGQVLVNDGFNLQDRQSLLLGRVGRPGVPPVYGAEPFRELDGRAGVYGGVEVRYLNRVVVRALHYDNRADPTVVDRESPAIAWATRFNTAGIRVESATGWTAIVQWLDGQTVTAPGGNRLEWPFRASFALISRQIGRHHTLTARYDRFEVDTSIEDGDGAQRGHAWTAAYVFTPTPRWRLTLEWLRVLSDTYYREEYTSGPSFARETQVQLAIRYALGPGAR